MDGSPVATDDPDSAVPEPSSSIGGHRHLVPPGRGGPITALAAAVLATLAVGAAILRPDPPALAEGPRDAAARVAAVVADGVEPDELSELGTDALRRQLADSRSSTEELQTLTDRDPDTPVVLATDEREARALVVFRGDTRRRLELVLLHQDGQWRLDRFEVY